MVKNLFKRRSNRLRDLHMVCGGCFWNDPDQAARLASNLKGVKMEMIRNTRIYQWIYQMDNETFVTISSRWCIFGLVMLIFYFLAPYLAIAAKYGAILSISTLFVFMIAKIVFDKLDE